jgi:DNA polymerase IV
MANASTSELHDDQRSRPHGQHQKRPAAEHDHAQAAFACMRKNEGVSRDTNPNSGTIDILDKMAQYYDRIGDHWRTISYRKCITTLKRQSEHITTREQAIKIAGIGERLADKVEEIACTNKLRRLESTAVDSNDQLLQLFMGIYQVGLPTASRWIAQGHKSLDDLKSTANLTANQRIGIDHYDDFMTRIPRSEVTAHADVVREACAKADKEAQLIVGGSYRRGAAGCGDIDLIITKENASLEYIRTMLVDTVIPRLFEQGFLKVGLATSSSRSGDHGSKWHGACALPGSPIWRRIDLLFVPWDEYGAALIYFTGNDIFNRSLRLLARRKKMRLNQHGLYGDVMRGEKRERITQGKLLEGRSEERIFEILGVPWRPPEHRIC